MLKKVWLKQKRDGWAGLIRAIAYLAARKIRSLSLIHRIYVHRKNRRALKKMSQPVKLHLGCGTVHLDGYANIDIEDWGAVCDIIAGATHLDMFADNQVDEIFSHALLEHIPPWDTKRTLREWYRVLKPGGKIRCEVPDLERIYEDWLVEGILSEDEAINNIYGGKKKPDKAYQAQDHLTGFTFDRLARFLGECGFRECKRVEHEKYHHILCITAQKRASI